MSESFDSFIPYLTRTDISTNRVPLSGPGHFLPAFRQSEHSGKVSSHLDFQNETYIGFDGKWAYLYSPLDTNFAASAATSVTTHRKDGS